MRYIRKVVAAGEASDQWLEEQCQFLAARLLRANGLALRQADRLTATKRSTRRELHRRVMLARELIDSQYQQTLSLPELAAASHLSSHHLLRAFKQILGLTPHAYLRANVPPWRHRLLADTDLQVLEIAMRVGFESRSALFRAVRDHFRTSPKALRKAGLPID